MERLTGIERNASDSATRADARPLFPEAKRRVRLGDVDRLLEGFVDYDTDGLHTDCDGEATCAAYSHAAGCMVASDPLRTRGSLRAHRIA